MKTFLEVVEEIKKSFDQDDASILAAIEDSLETDLTAASIRHLEGTFFVYNKKVYKAIQLIPVGDPIVIGTAGTPGVNAVLAEDIMSLIAGIGDSKFGDFAAVTDVTIDGVIYHTYWKVAPTNSNQVSGLAIHPTTGQLCEVYNNQGTYSLTSFTTEIQALTNDISLFGAVNVIKNNFTTQVVDGTLSINIDDEGVFTLTGSVASAKYIAIGELDEHFIGKKLKFIKDSWISNSVAYFYLQYKVGTTNYYKNYMEGEFTIPTNATNIGVYLYVNSSFTFNGEKLFPMLTLASYNGPYAPYTMTNQKLTEEVGGIVNRLDDMIMISTNTNFLNIPQGVYRYNSYGGNLTSASPLYQSQGNLIVSGADPIARYLMFISEKGKIVWGTIDSLGQICKYYTVDGTAVYDTPFK